MNRIHLVDISSLFFRAFYAIRPLTSPQGVPVNAVYGCLSMITKLIKDERPTHMVFCYDRKEPSFRKELYTEYKANRTEMPEDLGVQIPLIKKMIQLLGVPTVEVADYEADDIIGTLTCLALKNQFEVVIVSGDKDFGQLIQPGVVLYDTMKEIKYDLDGIVAKWGVTPSQFIDYLAIVGDASDNVPGVRGIGEKGAVKLLTEFKDLDHIYQNIELIKGATKDKLLQAKEMAYLSRKLVTIVQDIPVETNLDTYRIGDIDRDGLRAFLQELNFKSFEKSILGDASQDTTVTVPSQIKSDGQQSDPQSTQQPSLNTVQSKRSSGIDSGSQNKGISPFQLGLIELSATPTEVRMIEVQTKDLANHLKPQAEVWLFELDKNIYLYFANLLFKVLDAEFLGKLTDTFQVQWIGFDLKKIFHQINCKKPQIKEDFQLLGYSIETADWSQFEKSLSRVIQNPAVDLLETEDPLVRLNQLKMMQEGIHQRLSDESIKIYETLEKPLIQVLYKMESRGILISPTILKAQSLDLAKDLELLEIEIKQLANEDFNIGSPKQLAVILFEKMGLPSGKKTKTGYSTDNEVLEAIDHEIARKVLSWRELSKLKSTYVDSLPELISAKDGRVHTEFKQALTTTGRLSSQHPNLQNIPIKTPRGQLVRTAFIAAEGMKVLSVDYSQIELRLLAHISGDPGLTKAFEEDLDIHTATAAEIYGVSLSEVTSSLRRSAKAVNFGIAYGQGAFGLAENLGISRSEAKDIIDRYFQKFQGVQSYIETTIREAYEKGYVETLFGRKRYLQELSSKMPMVKKFGERAAINAPIQGTASDLMKKAMIEISQKVSVPMLLQVHDELIFEGTESELNESLTQIKSIMEKVMTLKVPLKVNAAIGNNWDEAH